jgi:hypothetical protein
MTYTPIKVRIKLLLKKIVPTFIFDIILRFWRSTFSKMFNDVDIMNIYTKEFLTKYGRKVVGGPFAGLVYVNEAAGSSYLIKLIGVYEEILHETITKVMNRGYSTMIDIGCAEGYYLIGIGRASKETKLIGYDIDKKALALTQELYNLNKLSNKLTLLENCTPEDLNSRIDGKTFLMCDAEGFEEEILNPAKSPVLAQVETFLVELHDFAAPNIRHTLTERFKDTHTINVITFKNGDAEKYPFLREMKNKKDVYTLLRERGEQEQEWLVMERK